MECFTVWNHRENFEEANPEVASELENVNSAAITTRKRFRKVCNMSGVSYVCLPKKKTRNISHGDGYANSRASQFVNMQHNNPTGGSLILSKCLIAEDEEIEIGFNNHLDVKLYQF